MICVQTMEAASQPAVMYFAVGKNSSREATAAVLDHPQIEPGDQVTSTDRLTPTEIWSYRLRPDEVRPMANGPKAPGVATSSPEHHKPA